MAKKTDSWMLPVLGIAGLGAVALFVLPHLTGKNDGEDDESPERGGRTRNKSRHHKNDGYGDLYRDVFMERPPVKRLPVVDVSDLMDRRGLAEDDDAYIITDKDFKLFDINRKDLPGYQRRIKKPTLDKVIYGDKGDRPVIVPYYDGYSYYTEQYDRQPELGRLRNESQSRINDRTNHLNLYSR
jgi:hypothetical protein